MAPVLDNQKLGFFQTTSLVTGNLVGSGVFLLPAGLAIFGSTSLIAWLLTGLGALTLAWIFAKMSMKYPSNGGPHYFVTKAFGPSAGYWVAWGYWVLSWISNAALIVAAVSYFSAMVGDLSPWQSLLMQMLILVGITSINILGIKTAGKFELVFTTLKLIPLVGIPLIGLCYIDWTAISWVPPKMMSTADALKSAMFLTIWAFVGLETATVTSSEVKNAQKTVPLATLCGTTIALIIYLLGAWVMLALLGSETLQLAKAPYADLAQRIFSGNWNTFIALAAVICCIGSFNGWTMVVGRIAQGAANEGLFPAVFAKVNKHNTPVVSLIISAICTMPLLFLSLHDGLLMQFNMIVDISITLILWIYVVVILAYFKIFKMRQAWVACVAIAFVVFSLWAAGSKMVLLSLLLLALGLPARYLFKRTGVRALGETVAA